MSKSLFPLTLSAFLLAGCATMQTYTFDRSRDIAAPEPVVWAALMDFFTRNSVSIKTLERDSGVVYAERMFGDVDEFDMFADCGSSFPATSAPPSTLALNAFVSTRPDAPNVTVLAINTQFTERLQMQVMFNVWYETRLCNSRGTLEDLIFEQIENYIDANAGQ